jgi:hypothetical protein
MTRLRPSRSLQATAQEIVITVLFLFGTLDCYGQSNVYSISFDGVTTYYYPGRWVVGSPPHRFGLEEYSYWSDSAGKPLRWGRFPERTQQQPSDIFHRLTRVLLGPTSFSVPLPPLAVALIGGCLVLGIGFVFIARHPSVRPTKK